MIIVVWTKEKGIQYLNAESLSIHEMQELSKYDGFHILEYHHR